MSFRERAAWVMGFTLILTGGYYLKLVIGDGVSPSSAAFPFVIGVTILSIAAQVVLAALSPREASSPVDERERLVIQKAANFSSYVLATGVVVALGIFMVSEVGMQLFNLALISLILAKIAEYGAQIFLLRSRV
ncbi:hypothetical protein [Altererythrobacter lutimaris]|uniref:DUF2178 domain-containing protein n=1 Tax=Altererythrobacter lutimaris TaxID=2743979 RepID=A0A850HBD6_9SPHN|nr:hypothetical protein [Altererythrobacter lutimaris]NVE93858.1 hypothetical protein [Altererythrobacter lutimaris]